MGLPKSLPVFGLGDCGPKSAPANSAELQGLSSTTRLEWAARDRGLRPGWASKRPVVQICSARNSERSLGSRRDDGLLKGSKEHV